MSAARRTLNPNHSKLELEDSSYDEECDVEQLDELTRPLSKSTRNPRNHETSSNVFVNRAQTHCARFLKKDAMAKLFVAAVVLIIFVLSGKKLVNTSADSYPRTSDFYQTLCHRAASAHGEKEGQLYQHVPGSLELLQGNRVVCPGQTQKDLENGDLTSASPDDWVEVRTRKPNKGKGMIVFKRGGSGSTWFDTMMASHPDFDFRHEAHHSLYKEDRDDLETRTKIMNQFLLGETCKSENGWCGFSISPTKHASGVDWKAMLETTGATLVVFVRTNVIKRALGLLRKQKITHLPASCRTGSSYSVDAKTDPDCMIETATELTSSHISQLESDCFNQTWDLLSTALETGAPFQVLTYEGLQQSIIDSFDRLDKYSGWPLSSYDWSHHQSTAKVTSEDLHDTISNYAEVEQSLVDKSCFMDMLHSQSREISPLCYIPKDFMES